MDSVLRCMLDCSWRRSGDVGSVECSCHDGTWSRAMGTLKRALSNYQSSQPPRLVRDGHSQVAKWGQLHFDRCDSTSKVVSGWGRKDLRFQQRTTSYLLLLSLLLEKKTKPAADSGFSGRVTEKLWLPLPPFLLLRGLWKEYCGQWRRRNMFGSAMHVKL